MKSDSAWRVRWRGVSAGGGSDAGKMVLGVRGRASRSFVRLVRRGGEGGGDAGVYFQRAREGCEDGPLFEPALEAGGEELNKGHVLRSLQSWACIEVRHTKTRGLETLT